MKSTTLTIGQKFGHLTVLELLGRKSKTDRNIQWKFKCDCGQECVKRGNAVATGHVNSCGCSLRETDKKRASSKRNGEANRTHGLGKTPTWSSWSMMVARCTNPKRKQYEDYGGRGIVPCEFLRSDPRHLVAVIGERPNLGMSLDRKDNALGYYCGQCPQCKAAGWPLNVQWSTRETQAHNKRNNVWVEIDGVRKLRHQWAQEMGVSIGYIRTHYADCEV